MRGFTLSELMIASAILIIAMLGLLAAYINFSLVDQYNQHRMVAFNDAQYVLEQCKSQAYGSLASFISSYNTNQFNNLVNERVTFPNCSGGSCVALRMATITVQITWNERGYDKYLQLSTKIARSEE